MRRAGAAREALTLPGTLLALQVVLPGFGGCSQRSPRVLAPSNGAAASPFYCFSIRGNNNPPPVPSRDRGCHISARGCLFSWATCDLPTVLPHCVGASLLIPSPRDSAVGRALSSRCETTGTDLAPGSRSQPLGTAVLVVTQGQTLREGAGKDVLGVPCRSVRKERGKQDQLQQRRSNPAAGPTPAAPCSGQTVKQAPAFPRQQPEGAAHTCHLPPLQKPPLHVSPWHIFCDHECWKWM